MNEWASLLVPGVSVGIAAMAGATYLCRISGYFLMSIIPFTPALRRALAALPGSIVAATVLPVIERTGLVAGMAILAALCAMMIRRSELLALASGLVVAVAARALGL